MLPLRPHVQAVRAVLFGPDRPVPVRGRMLLNLLTAQETEQIYLSLSDLVKQWFESQS